MSVVKYLAISSAYLTAVDGFKAPFLFKKSQRSPCTTWRNEIKKATFCHITVKLQQTFQEIMFHRVVGQKTLGRYSVTIIIGLL